MINIYYGDFDRVSFELDYLSIFLQKSGKKINVFYENSISLKETYNRYHIGDIFGKPNNNDSVLFVCDNFNKINYETIEKFNNAGIDLYIFTYSESIKIRGKAIPKYWLLNECKKVNKPFGGVDEKEIRDIIHKIKSITGDTFGNDLLEFLIINSYYGGIFHDLQSVYNIYSIYNDREINDIYEMFFLKDNHVLSLFGYYIQNNQMGKFIEILSRDNINIISSLTALQTVTNNLCKICDVMISDNETDADVIALKIKDVNKFFIIKNMNYISKRGIAHIKYMYKYFSKMIAYEIDGQLKCSKNVKIQDIVNVINGNQSIFL